MDVQRVLERAIRMQKLIFALVLLCFPLAAYAQDMDCGDPPIVANETTRAAIEGKAEFAYGFLGKAELGGEIEKSREDVFREYPNADKANADRYLQYQICIYLYTDDTLTNLEKIARLLELRKAFLEPVTISPDSSSLPEQYFYRFWQFAYSCNVELPISALVQDVGNKYVEEHEELQPLGQVYSLAFLKVYQEKAALLRVDVMKTYECSQEGTDYKFSSTLLYRYRDENGITCGMFKGETNHPFMGFNEADGILIKVEESEYCLN